MVVASTEGRTDKATFGFWPFWTPIFGLFGPNLGSKCSARQARSNGTLCSSIALKLASVWQKNQNMMRVVAPLSLFLSSCHLAGKKGQTSNGSQFLKSQPIFTKFFFQTIRRTPPTRWAHPRAPAAPVGLPAGARAPQFCFYILYTKGNRL